ncbi:MAG: Uncharacterised protein [Flavobacterium sp. SCGC AAA160-P02]|nr:MAG: Uncharacterised protein [Flavobacterium sp. SCGC AAA160-P02]
MLRASPRAIESTITFPVISKPGLPFAHTRYAFIKPLLGAWFLVPKFSLIADFAILFFKTDPLGKVKGVAIFFINIFFSNVFKTS